MEFGVALVGIRPEDAAGIARAVDEAGFESLWIPEHLFFPVEIPPTYPYTESGALPVDVSMPWYDPWVQLAYYAAVTKRIRLATCIYILPLRHPLVTARAVQTLDTLSGGRVTVGIGVGWLEEEFAWAGQSFGDRGARTDEIIAVLRKLWRDDVVEHHGEHYEFGPLKFEPKPVQNPIPLLVGGISPAALRRAGRLGDGWIDIGSTDYDDVRDKVARIQEHRRAAGRENLPFEITVTGSLVTDLDSVRRAADAGVTRVVASPSQSVERGTPQAIGDWAERFFDEVVRKFEQPE
jgi:probable F420-dependent oxidoreductase